jgi:hypothetical protein
MTEELEELEEGSVTYIIMLAAFQVVLNCQFELKGTIYDQGPVANKVREAVNMLNLKNSRNRDSIWKVDDKRAADMMFAIDKIAGLIATSDGLALTAIADLFRQGIDFNRVLISELSDEELEKIRATM